MPSKSRSLGAAPAASNNDFSQPVRPLDEWAAGRTQSLPLSALKGAVVGIDASHYINQHLVNQSTREALLGALGGFPFALRSNIEKELQTFKNLGVACVFVFNGLEFGQKEKDQRTPPQPPSARSFEQAWDLYDQQQADQVVDAFSNAGMTAYHPSSPSSPYMAPYHMDTHPHCWTPTSPWTPITPWTPISPTLADTDVPSGNPPPETLYKFLQRILDQNGIDFIVAPYSAAAQVSGKPNNKPQCRVCELVAGS